MFGNLVYDNKLSENLETNRTLLKITEVVAQIIPSPTIGKDEPSTIWTG